METAEKLSAALEASRLQAQKVKKLEAEFNEMSELLTEAANKIEDQTNSGAAMENELNDLRSQLLRSKFDIWTSDSSFLLAVDVPGVTELKIVAEGRLVKVTGVMGTYEQATLVEDYNITTMGRLPQDSPDFIREVELPGLVASSPVKIHVDCGTAYVTLKRVADQ